MTPVTQNIAMGNTVLFKEKAYKSSALWDITGGTVLLYLTKPDGTELSPLTATVLDGPNGIAGYQVDTTVLDTVGDWKRQWKTTVASIVMWSDEIYFYVGPSRA